jgi:hypothetical protein
MLLIVDDAPCALPMACRIAKAFVEVAEGLMDVADVIERKRLAAAVTKLAAAPNGLGVHRQRCLRIAGVGGDPGQAVQSADFRPTIANPPGSLDGL